MNGVRIYVPKLVVAARFPRFKAGLQSRLEASKNWYYDNRDWVWFPFIGIVAVLVTGILVMRYLN